MSEARERENLWESNLRRMPENEVRLHRMLYEARERAERAEAELAALRERVRDRAWAFDAMGQHVHAAGLMDLLDDDTTGAASGEGEK